MDWGPIRWEALLTLAFSWNLEVRPSPAGTRFTGFGRAAPGAGSGQDPPPVRSRRPARALPRLPLTPHCVGAGAGEALSGLCEQSFLPSRRARAAASVCKGEFPIKCCENRWRKGFRLDPRGPSTEQSRGNYLNKLDCKQNLASLNTACAQGDREDGGGGGVGDAGVCLGWEGEVRARKGPGSEGED